MSAKPPEDFTHFRADGAAHMVEISHKAPTPRSATAKARVRMSPETKTKILAGQMGKGDVLGIARIAGIGGAKRCSDLIPLCHPVGLTAVDIDFVVDLPEPVIEILARADCVDRTGPEMEAMTAASAAALTIYDMCKSIDRAMAIESILLTQKSGGKSGHWVRPA